MFNEQLNFLYGIIAYKFVMCEYLIEFWKKSVHCSKKCCGNNENNHIDKQGVAPEMSVWQYVGALSGREERRRCRGGSKGAGRRRRRVALRAFTTGARRHLVTIYLPTMLGHASRARAMASVKLGQRKGAETRPCAASPDFRPFVVRRAAWRAARDNVTRPTSGRRSTWPKWPHPRGCVPAAPSRRTGARYWWPAHWHRRIRPARRRPWRRWPGRAAAWR